MPSLVRSVLLISFLQPKNWVTMRGTSAIETVLASLFKDDRMMSALKEGELIMQWREQNPHRHSVNSAGEWDDHKAS